MAVAKRKQLSGAAKRKKAAVTKAAVAVQAKALGLIPADGAPADNGASNYDVLGDPDIDDAATGLEYVRKAQLIAFGEVCRDPSITKETRWRLIKEMGQSMGFTHVKANVESRLAKAEKKQQAEEHPPAAQVIPTNGITRPTTARPRRSSGPRDGSA